MGLRDWHVRRRGQRWIETIVICTAQLQIITEVRILGMLPNCEALRSLPWVGTRIWLMIVTQHFLYFFKRIFEFSKFQNCSKQARKLSLDFFRSFRKAHLPNSGSTCQSDSDWIFRFLPGNGGSPGSQKCWEKCPWVFFLSRRKSETFWRGLECSKGP